jgi:SNF2 family DNA or RNA helicase
MAPTEKFAEITTDGKRILAHIWPKYRPGSALARQVPGARAMWDKTVEPNVFLGWAYPLSMDTCRSFRKVFGESLRVLPPLVEWSREEVKRERKLEDFREGEMADVDLSRLEWEAPDLLAAMKARPYQLAGAGFILAGRTVILGDDPGLGKTLQALAAVVQSDSKVILVGCRRTATRTVWERETARWAPGIATFVAQGSPQQREDVFKAFDYYPVTEPGARKMLIINIEMVRAKREEYCPDAKGECYYPDGQSPADHPAHQYSAHPKWPFLFGIEWDAIIFDESHNLLASTKNIQSKNITQQRFGAMKLRLRDGGIRIALSGTPFRSKLEKGWGTLNWLQPKLFGSFWRWAETYFDVQSNGYRGAKTIGGMADEAGWDRMLRPWYLKRTKKEAAPDLPDIIFAGTPIRPEDPESPCYVVLDMVDNDGKPSKQAQAYRKMEAEAEANLEGGRITATGVLAEITRKRQFANAYAARGDGRSTVPADPSNKLDWILDFMSEREDTDGKVVIASSFTEMVEFTAAALRKAGWEVLTLTGATSDRDRSDLVARFQDPNDPLRVVVINREAGGESITLDRADEMIVIDQPWISDKDEQLTARIHRVSRVHQVTIYRLVSKDTIDEWMASLTDDQREVLSTASPRKLSEALREATGDE